MPTIGSRPAAVTVALFLAACAPGGDPRDSSGAGDTDSGRSGAGGNGSLGGNGIVITAGTSNGGVGGGGSEYCGDGLIDGSREACDDGSDETGGAPVSGDGCSQACELERGYVCPRPGARCQPLCGDGTALGRETCDDANGLTGDGCDENCQLEAGWVCPPGGTCRPTVCGDATREGSEECDDANVRPYDGCSPSCTKEPVCGTAASAVGECLSTCGDGILLASSGEACDDGNELPDDGCDPTCQLEPGYECTTLVDEPPEFVDVPIVIRDFRTFQSWAGPGNTNPVGHPDFGPHCCAHQTGIVEDSLGADRKPVYRGTDAAPINMTSGESYFDQWYRDVDGLNQRHDQMLRLGRQPSGAYSMNSALDEPWAGLGGFFPIDMQGFGNEFQNHNFSFTSELRYWFEFGGDEVLNFSGDDDVWVFVNGHLALDLGGVHDRTYGTVSLAPNGHAATCIGQGCTPSGDVDLTLVTGHIYEVVVLQAERHGGGSNYWLTLTNFLPRRSRCAPVCGDGVVTPDEACDLGSSGNTGERGTCTPDCTLPAFCGDGVLQTEFEECDEGENNGGSVCRADCTKQPIR